MRVNFMSTLTFFSGEVEELEVSGLFLSAFPEMAKSKGFLIQKQIEGKRNSLTLSAFRTINPRSATVRAGAYIQMIIFFLKIAIRDSQNL